jgi:endonuclease/exonuclease/phosphatase family metal-dependent hydrolase
MTDAPATQVPALRVMQLNVGSLLEPGWDQRRLEVVAWIDRLQPDVVCLQEIWESSESSNTASWIVEHLAGGPWHWAFGGAPFGPRLWDDPTLRFGSAILSRWPIDQHTYHALPVLDDPDPFVSDVPWELLHVQTAGLDVFSTHLAAAPHQGDHRAQQVLAIDRLVKAARGEKDAMARTSLRTTMPPILCVDFNAEPDSDEIRFLSSLAVLDGHTTFYQDAWRVAGGDGPGYTQDWRTNPLAASLNVHRKRIDYVFVGDPFRREGHAGRVLAAEVVGDTSITGTLASDHAGLVVDILWPQRPPVDPADPTRART